jgi:hypothetical protein
MRPARAAGAGVLRSDPPPPPERVGVPPLTMRLVAVQVKYTAQTTRDGCPLLCVARWVRRHASEQPVWKPFPAHVDVLMVLVEGVGWYVIPRERVGDRRNMTLGRSMDEWREAWSVFDAA